MPKQTSIMVSIIISIIVLSLGFSTNLLIGNEDYTSNPTVCLSYSSTEHAPIMIGSNSDFSSYGFTGIGSQSEPYIIENLAITTNNDCITIGNTTVYFTIRNCVLQSSSGVSGIGILLQNVSHATIESCAIATKYSGIDAQTVTQSLISNITTRNGMYGIKTNLSNNITISYSCIQDNERTGVELRSSQFCTVNESYIQNNMERGIFVVFSATCNISGNIIMNNRLDGIYLYYSDICVIRDNGIYDNGAYGIVITLGNDNHVFGNGFGWNTYSALDNGNNNTWDLISESLGNYWSDFKGTSTHLIDGVAASEDRFPNYIMKITTPSNAEYIEASTIESIFWDCEVFRPNQYRILVNSVLTENMSWNGSLIDFQFTLSKVGLFNYTLIIFDETGHHLSSTVLITIRDITIPTINSPIDIEYLEGFEGNFIRWQAHDTQPKSYILFRNNIKLVSTGWYGEEIQISIDGLNPGTYFYKIIVFDLGGNSIDDIVMVTVLENYFQTSTTVSSPTTSSIAQLNPWYSPVLGGSLFLVGSFVILIAVFVNTGVILRKRNV